PPPPPRAQPLRLPVEAAVLGENGATLPPLDSELAKRVAAAVAKGGDAPPAVDFRAMALYPETQRRAGVSGEAKVRFTISATGYPENVRPWTSSAPEFGRAAVESVKQWRFIPAIKDGNAVSTFVELTLTF
ncbi:MAG: energy transducer TonB, partial [Verrucomicrobia bacterium]|nr:energy transducer TonB [Verrucomicrobiota bacterium]